LSVRVSCCRHWAHTDETVTDDKRN
jgi:hypothetical protein